MMKRIKIKANDPIQSAAERLSQLGCLPHQIQKHITALSRPKPEPRHAHLSEVDQTWMRQLAQRPALDSKGFQRDEASGRFGASRRKGWKQIIGRV